MSKTLADPKAVLATNLQRLMDKFDYKQADVAKKAGVAQKTLSNILAARNAATLDVIADIAKVFKVSPWQLMLPELPEDLAGEKQIEIIVLDYTRSTPRGREHILMVAEREAEYSTGATTSID